VPIILSGFLFGLRGAGITSLSITALYTPFVMASWSGFSPEDFNTVIELILFNAIGVMLGMLRDREREKQRRLRDAECLAAMGRAVSGVAHDMKSPLMGIGGFTALAQKEIGEDHPSYQKLDIVLQQTQRLEHMMKDLLDFARPLDLHCTPQDINQMVSQSVVAVTGEAQKMGVRIESDLGEDLPQAGVDILRMERVLVNLLSNAVQASLEGSTVTVRTFGNERGVMIDVVDCGCGIKREQREKIFEPFFTTKKEGTGLGLSIAKKIVETHSGEIKILDNPEKGVTFRVVLPACSRR
jgi:signal transduction histidine kinase